jgi:transposase InsO family protein
MPWKKATHMSQRTEFVAQAKLTGANMSALCRAFGISRKTGYKWLKREQALGPEGLADQTRRPRNSPKQTDSAIEARVLEVRQEHKAWGGRKIRRVLQNAACEKVPAASTITAILHRHDQIDPQEAQEHKPFQRFEREQPNELWQMDFKGYFPLQAGGSCHPLTVIDDHSRFLLGLKACPNETSETVQNQLTAIFQRFGLPDRMLMDNGSPWRGDQGARQTVLTVWLLRLGIRISHGRAYHPQTQGKDERLHRTLLAEVISQHSLSTLQESQTVFDDWWQTYNYVRPHEALQMLTPSACYQPSARPFPASLPPIVYENNDLIRKVDMIGRATFQSRIVYIGRAFRFQSVAFRPTDQNGVFDIFFCQQKLAQINLQNDNHP